MSLNFVIQAIQVSKKLSLCNQFSEFPYKYNMMKPIQAMVRDGKVQTLASLITDNMVLPEHDRIWNTGSLLPTNTLRHRSTRSLLSWATSLEPGRWFTQKLVRDALDLVMKQGRLTLPEGVPGFSPQTWLNDESAKLHRLLLRAKKSTVDTAAAPEPPVPSLPAMADIDTCDTLPWTYSAGSLDSSEDRAISTNRVSPTNLKSFASLAGLPDFEEEIVQLGCWASNYSILIADLLMHFYGMLGFTLLRISVRFAPPRDFGPRRYLATSRIKALGVGY